VFHFNFGSSLIDLWRIGLPLFDLRFYKDPGKIVVTYNGCDARQKYPTMERVPFSACHNHQCYGGICNSGMLDKVKQRKIAIFDQYADAIFAVNPDLMHFLPKRAKFLPYSIADWAKIETPAYQVGRSLKIIHSPTNRGAKGSDIIMNALDLLKKSYGDKIEVILVENVPYQKARQMYAEADLAIDQILIGWYGGFAVEMMKMGKPVMAFIRKEDLQFLPEDMARDCQHAFIQVEPSSIYEKLCELIENPSILKNYREAGLEYVYRWHDPVYVAGITKSIYES
jgi:glycosyltransferase involved in cell wall biosynthesis